jgi:phage recombination protein Bet
MSGNTPKAIEVVSAATVDVLTDEKIEVVKQTVAKGATDAELAMFLAVAQKYDLDPFAKEIFFIKEKPGDPGRVQTGRDGFLAIANRHGEYQGMTSDVVFLGDTFRRTKDGVDHGIDFATRKATIIGAYALVYRSDRQIPSYGFARWAEYAPKDPPGWSPWHKYPSAMIIKVAETIALKKAFSISGVGALGISEPDDGEPDAPRPDAPLQLPSYKPPRVARLHDEDSPPAEDASTAFEASASPDDPPTSLDDRSEGEHLFTPEAEAAADAGGEGWEDKA